MQQNMNVYANNFNYVNRESGLNRLGKALVCKVEHVGQFPFIANMIRNIKRVGEYPYLANINSINERPGQFPFVGNPNQITERPGQFPYVSASC